MAQLRLAAVKVDEQEAPKGKPKKAAKKEGIADLPTNGLRGVVETPGEIKFLPPQDVLTTLAHQKKQVAVTMLDPWYNRGVGGIREDYHEWLASVVEAAARVSDHIFIWGFSEIVCHQVSRLPAGVELNAWLTWYYKNCPSVVKGWRSSQEACLHLTRAGAKMYPEHFLNEAQVKLRDEKKLRYMPSPTTVIEVPMNIGFVGRAEQTDHPSQKPERVYEQILMMTTKLGDTVLDPMCGSGTTGAVARRLGVNSILCDASPDYLGIARARLSK